MLKLNTLIEINSQYILLLKKQINLFNFLIKLEINYKTEIFYYI